MDVSIIIVNYNVKEYIISCIESIYKQTDSNYKFEIIVIDNNSHDGSQKVIKEKFSNIKFIENKKNYGFSKAVNQASYYASGENLFILNPDTLFIENTINKLLIESKKLDISGIIGPKIIDGNGKIIRSYWRKPTLKSAILSILHLDSLNFKKNLISIAIKNVDSSLVGYAGDGFEIHYRPFEKKSGWTLKQGMRPLGGPSGPDAKPNRSLEFASPDSIRVRARRRSTRPAAGARRRKGGIQLLAVAAGCM